MRPPASNIEWITNGGGGGYIFFGPIMLVSVKALMVFASVSGLTSSLRASYVSKSFPHTLHFIIQLEVM